MKRILDFIDIYNDSNVRAEISHRLENRDSTEDHYANNLRYFHSQTGLCQCQWSSIKWTTN